VLATARKSTRLLLASLALVAAGSSAASEQAPAKAIRAEDFLSTLGVATHIDYTDGQYSDIGKVIESLRYLGISRVRDHAPNPASDPVGQRHLGTAAKAGIKFIFTFRGNDPHAGVKLLREFEERHPGSITAIEGPNEVNNWPISYNGLKGTEAAQALQAALYDLAKQDPLLRDLPVIGFTDYPVHSSKADWNNGHPYSRDGGQPSRVLLESKLEQDKVDPGRPFIVTETGYHTGLAAHKAGGWRGVDPTSQAKLILNTYVGAARLGFKGTYIYQLLDAYPDPDGSNQERQFGLFDVQFRPKPSARAVRALVRILQDDPAADAFETTALPYSVTDPEEVKTLLVQKSTGALALIVWNEPDIWNEDAPIAIPPKKVTVDLSRPFTSVRIFDPLIGPDAVQSLSARREVEVEVSGSPVIIEAVP
jgi:hypothetical protein